MEANQILKTSWLDLLFEGRNKTYGAYELRKTYNRRISWALVGMLAVVGAILMLKSLAGNGNITEAPIITVEENRLSQQPKQPEEEKIIIPPKTRPMKPVATVQVSTPRIVPNEMVTEPPTDIHQIERAQIDIKTQAGEEFTGVVAPPQTLEGTSVIATPTISKKNKDQPATFVEIEAQFPGGESEWTKYVRKSLVSKLDEFKESDYGTCIIKFVVDKTGKVSQVEAQTMKGTKLAEIAVNAIRNGPRWIPAQQNGRYVSAYRIQPVTLQNPNF